MLLLFVVLIIFLLTSYLLILGITLPLNTLITYMRDIEQGRFDFKIPTKGRDEISQLKNGFNVMLKEINQLIVNIQEEKEKEKFLTLQVLYAQINPHFLFNTLNTIKWIAYINQSPNIAELIASLGRLLEMSLDKMDECISVKEEIENLNSYLKIQKARYNQQFNLEVKIPNDLMELNVPKLIFQPLVENSFIHSLNQKENKKIQIRIIGEITEKKLLFRVEDDGRGMKPADLISLNKSLNEKIGEGIKGIGLANVHQRIQLIFGSNFGLNVSSEYGKGVTVNVLLPLKGGNDND